MTKPALSEIEANWNIHYAGILAEKAAREKGITEGDSENLLNAAVGGKIIGGVLFPPIHAGLMLMLSKLAKVEKWTALYTSEMDNAAALGLLLQCPQIAWPLLRDGHEDAFINAVIDFASAFTMQNLGEIFLWITSEMDRLKTQGEAAGKPTAE